MGLWDKLDPTLKINIKGAFMNMLGREDLNEIKCAATCIAAIGEYEIPKG
jgi:hypothetical protein